MLLKIFKQQNFIDLPSRFLILGLSLYVGLELLATYALSHATSLDSKEQIVILMLRVAELLGFIALIQHFKLFKTLGLDKPSREAWLVFYKIALFCFLSFVALYLLFPQAFVYVHLPVWLHGGLGLLLMVVIAPMVEELIFRGLLYRMLRERWGVWVSVLVSAFFFSMVHHGLLFSPQLVGGIIFALAYEWSRSLWVSIALHMGANSAVYALSVYVSTQ